MPDMGIEFTSLDQVTRKRLQQQVETIAVECLKSAQTQKSGKLGFAAERTRFDVIVASNLGWRPEVHEPRIALLTTGTPRQRKRFLL